MVWPSDIVCSYSFLLASSSPDFLSLVSLFLPTSCMAAFRLLRRPAPALMTTACVRNARERLVRVMCEVLRCVITLLLDPAPEERPDKTQAVREREEFLPDLHHQIESSPHTPAEESRLCTPAANIRQATRHRHLRVYLTSLTAAPAGSPSTSSPAAFIPGFLFFPPCVSSESFANDPDFFGGGSIGGDAPKARRARQVRDRVLRDFRAPKHSIASVASQA